MDTLPAVAKSFSTYCKKCDTDRYHLVLSHKNAHSAKVECEVCKAKSTYSTLKKRQRSFEPKKKSETPETWQDVQKKLDKENAKKYSIKESFDEENTIEHPKFGFGFVMKSEPKKIEVVFEEGIKALVQNR